MGIRVRPGSIARLSHQLDKISDTSTRELRRVARDGAFAMRDVAREMAPFKIGDLEGSIEVEEEITFSTRRKTFEIQTTGIPYAIFMHEHFYELGPGSSAKQGRSRFTVGRKYMSRALDWLINDWGLYERGRRAVKRAVRRG